MMNDTDSNRILNEAKERLLNRQKHPNVHLEWHGNTIVASPIFTTSEIEIEEGGSSSCIQCDKCGLIRLVTENGCERCKGK